MNCQTKDTMIDYIASLGEYAASQAIEMNDFHDRFIEKINHLEDDVIRVKLQNLEQEVQQQLTILQKSIKQVDKHTNIILSSVETNVLNEAAKQYEELKGIKTQLEGLVNQQNDLVQYQKKILWKIDVNQQAIMKNLERNYKKANQNFDKMNNRLEYLGKKGKFGNVVGTLVLVLILGMIVYLYSVGVIL
ncbi:MAG: hypothetical protein FH756_05115 [Firmicutes bacterium]|nr:hypothetical protein [Bacillota bacterium]